MLEKDFLNLVKTVKFFTCTQYTKVLTAITFLSVMLLLNLVITSTAFSFTNSYADWYGLTFTTKSAISEHFYNLSGDNELSMDLLNSTIFTYIFEYNINPKLSLPITGGITFYKSFSDFLPMNLKYTFVGLDYNILLKIYGTEKNNLNSVNFGMGIGLGLNMEGIQILVGNSNLSSDYTKNELKHMNTVYSVNFVGSIKGYIEIPLNFYNIVKFPTLMYTFSYDMGVTVFGPFLPNLENVVLQAGEVEKTFTGMKHTLIFRLAF
ncbi:MAG: hypothetical protein ACK4R7_01515 [Fervidobacterium sp.]